MSTTPEIYVARAEPLAVFIGRCEPCDRPVRTSSDTFIGDHYPGTCTDCRKPVTFQRLYGTLSKMECHGACMSAYGPNCDCGCGGVNHGDIWSRPGEMLADALAVYRADRARRVAAAERAAQTRANAKAAQLQAAFAAWADDHRELIMELIETDWLTDPFPNDFLADMARMVNRGEPLTEPQTNRTVHILARRREVRERIAVEQAEQAARAVTMTEVPAGRQIITGEIIAAWTFEGDWGTVWKIKIDCRDYHVRGTLPRNLETEALPQPHSGEDFRNLGRTLRGRRVTLRATLMPDGREAGQGYFKRPSNAEFVTAPAEVSG